MYQIIIYIIIMAVIYGYIYNSKRKATFKDMQKKEGEKIITEVPANSHPVYINNAEQKDTIQSGLQVDLNPDFMKHYNENSSQKENTDNMEQGLRHDTGTPTLSGMKVIVCSYCGAENQVHGDGMEQEKCYFCWTKLTKE